MGELLGFYKTLIRMYPWDIMVIGPGNILLYHIRILSEPSERKVIFYLLFNLTGHFEVLMWMNYIIFFLSQNSVARE